MDNPQHSVIDDNGAILPVAAPQVSPNAFPSVYWNADKKSLRGQRRYLRATRLQLLSLLSAAVFGAVAWAVDRIDVASILATVCFAAALSSEAFLARERPERTWYASRAVAESAKTLTWRYLCGGKPFGLNGLDSNRAEALLLERLRRISRDIDNAMVIASSYIEQKQVTPEARNLRSLSLELRQEMYMQQRIGDQVKWYASTAQWNERASNRWSIVLAAGMMVGLTGGVLRAANVLDVDILGIVAAAVAAGTGWTQAKQHQNLASAYSVAVHDLLLIRESAEQVASEEEWAQFVNDAEDAISREHTTWRSSHS